MSRDTPNWGEVGQSTESGLAEVLQFPGTSAPGPVSASDPASVEAKQNKPDIAQLRQRIAEVTDLVDEEPSSEILEPEPATTASNVVKLGEFSSEDALADARELLTRALARSDKSRAECAGVLRNSTELLELERAQVLDELERLGYIDDLRLAERLVEGTFARKNLGRTGMERALRQRGIDEVTIDEALGEFDRDDEFASALEVAEARAEKLRGLEPETAKRRLYGFLARRGYSGEILSRAVSAALQSGRSDSRGAGPYFR